MITRWGSTPEEYVSDDIELEDGVLNVQVEVYEDFKEGFLGGLDTVTYNFDLDNIEISYKIDFKTFDEPRRMDAEAETSLESPHSDPFGIAPKKSKGAAGDVLRYSASHPTYHYWNEKAKSADSDWDAFLTIISDERGVDKESLEELYWAAMHEARYPNLHSPDDHN